MVARKPGWPDQSGTYLIQRKEWDRPVLGVWNGIFFTFVRHGEKGALGPANCPRARIEWEHATGALPERW